MLKAERLSKSYGTFKAVDDISFEAKDGEILGLLGANGAGKTTTLKIFCGLLKPTSGRAVVEGIDVMLDPIGAKAKIGYLPESPALYEKLTGFDLLMMIGALRGMEQGTLERRIFELAKVTELDSAINTEIGTYSKGMRQKVAFLSAVVHDPKVLILDEATSGLDPRSRKLVKNWILELGKLGRTILMSTHVTETAESICDKIAVIDKGKITAFGTVKKLCDETATENLEDAFVKLVGGNEWKMQAIVR